MSNGKTDPIGRSDLNLTVGQNTGLDKNPPAIDAINGLLTDASHESKQAGSLYAPLPNEGSYDKKRMLQAFDEAKRRMKR